MAQLIMTPEEEAELSYLKLSDDALGKMVRRLSLMILNTKDEKRPGQEAIFGSAALMVIQILARRANAAKASVILEGATFSDQKDGEMWELTMRRLDIESEEDDVVPNICTKCSKHYTECECKDPLIKKIVTTIGGLN